MYSYIWDSLYERRNKYLYISSTCSLDRLILILNSNPTLPPYTVKQVGMLLDFVLKNKARQKCFFFVQHTVVSDYITTMKTTFLFKFYC